MLTPIVISSTVAWAIIVAIAVYTAFKFRDTLDFNALVVMVSTAIWVPTIIGLGAHTAWPIVALVLLVLILLFEAFVASVIVIVEEHTADMMERNDVIHITEGLRRPSRGP